MAKTEMKSGANIGSASLILIFIVLCLGTFGLLSLTSANNDLELAERNAAAVSGYYRADGEGEAFRMKVEQAVAEALKLEEKDRAAYLEETLGEAYLPDEEAARTEIDMESGQALSIKLGIDWDGPEKIRVREWTVYNRVEYDIAQYMPVWTGV